MSSTNCCENRLFSQGISKNLIKNNKSKNYMEEYPSGDGAVLITDIVKAIWSVQF